MEQWKRYIQELKVLYILRWVMGVTTLTGCGLLLVDYGFFLSSRGQYWTRLAFLTIGAMFVAGYLAQLVIRHDRGTYLTNNQFKYVCTFAMLLEMTVVYALRIPLDRFEILAELRYLTSRDPHLFLTQCYILTNGIRWVVKISQFWAARRKTPPARFIIASFGGTILVGACLLLLPKATTTPLHPLDALFTATSAVCVTGLIVVDTPTAFTTTGQIVILGLIQIGGLGIMTVTAFFSLLVGQRMSGREQQLLGDILDIRRLAQLGSILRAVFLTTFLIEACGIGLLYLSWEHLLPGKTRFYTAVFHSISAFCNAGFSTFSDSLTGFATDIRINGIVCALIILGGLGFGTLRNLYLLVPVKTAREKHYHLSVQSKLVLLMTLGLLAAGTIIFGVLEHGQTLQELSLRHQVLGAFFQSVTFRTAGFNTVDFSQVRESTLMLGILLMFVGAAPGSTGGGIKVTTLAILWGTVLSSARGRSRLEIFHRTIPTMVLYQTLVVITLYLSVALVISFFLSITEAQFRPIELLFETVSALGTVGLSTGLTPHLSAVGKGLIILTMFLGRVGPFTLALAIGQRQRAERYRYPSTKVQIG